MAFVIAISSLKGGVSKSSSSNVLAYGINNRINKITKKPFKVLVIDNDFQMNLTTSMIKEINEETLSLYDIYAEKADIKDVRIQIKEGIDLVRSDFDLCSADLEFFKRPGSLKILSRAIDKVRHEYDIILIDCPPSLSFLTLSAYMASDYICCPLSLDSFSLKSVSLLKKSLLEVEEDVGKKIPVLGIILTRYTSRTNVSKALEQSMQTAAEVLETSIFKSRIRTATVLVETLLVRENLFSYAPRAPITADYNALVDEFLERVYM